jgi:very-short-patch-repair endonuclease
MSLNNKSKLIEITKVTCRELRVNSTEAEKKFWEAVRNKKFLGKKFYRQYPFFTIYQEKKLFLLLISSVMMKD